MTETGQELNLKIDSRTYIMYEELWAIGAQSVSTRYFCSSSLSYEEVCTQQLSLNIQRPEMKRKKILFLVASKMVAKAITEFIATADNVPDIS